MARFFRLAALLTMVLAMSAHAGAASAAGQGEPMVLPVDPSPLVVETGDGERRFTVEIADNDRARAAGLMFRTEMDDNHGMLFVFEQTRRLAFWMKNTPMPLDLVFIGEDGRIVSIMQGEPFSTASIGPEEPARFVLELRAGTAQKAGIEDGDRIRHPQIDRIAD